MSNRTSSAEVEMVETFDPSTLQNNARGVAKININKSGSFRINQAMMAQLSFGEGDEVAFSKDKEGNWYIFRKPGGFALRGSKDALTFNSSALAQQIGQFGSFLIAGQPTKVGKVQYWGILIPE